MKENNISESESPNLPGKTPRRVKVYLLQGEDWLDNGTGYCIGEVEPETSQPYFVVRNEIDANDIILKSSLEGSIQYQRQQETLIVWTDLSGKDLALSFQETEGCADLCEFIIRVQQENYSPDISLYYVIPNLADGEDITELITGPIIYPDDPTMENLDVVLDIISQGSNSQYTRTNILNYIIENQFLSKLIDIFASSEKEMNLTNLHILTEIIKTLILYNETSLIEDFLDTEEKVIGLIGILEYDPEYPNMKACHREFLKSKSFKEIVPVDNITIFKKDFHLNFLKDVVLARFLDDQTFNLISSLIYVNQVEIINFLKEPNLLQRIFNIYKGANGILKKDGVKMLHQYVLIAKTLQPLQKLEFFSILIKSGLFDMIRFALNDLDTAIRVLGIELIGIIIEQDVSLVHSIQSDETIENIEPVSIDNDRTIIEKNPNLRLSDDMTLIIILSNLLVNDKNPGLKIQAFEALKILLDSNISANTTNQISDNETMKSRNEFIALEDSKNSTDINTLNYFEAFYQEVAPTLFGKLVRLSTSSCKNDIKEIQDDELLYQQLCELISFCSREHDVFLSRSFFLQNNILLGVSRLLTSPCKSALKLSAIRCLKSIIVLNDNSYTDYIIENNLLSYFFSYFDTVVEENNLANSTCLDLLELILKLWECNLHLKKRNFHVLIQYIHNNYRDFCKNKINYVNTGKKFSLLVENGFYDVADSSKNDTSFDLDQDMIDKENVSTPPLEDEDETTKETPSKLSNLFESIERNYKNGEKRLREEEAEVHRRNDIKHEPDTSNKSKLSTSLKSKFSNGNKKSALSLQPNNTNNGNYSLNTVE